MATKELIDYSKKIFDELKLAEERRIGIIEKYIEFDIKYFSEFLNLEEYNYTIIKKENTKDFYMNWHLDNALVKKNKKDFVSTGISISERYSLHYFIEKPVYTLIVYESDYDIDFKGGIFEFIDGTIIKPQKGMYIFFNSNELHKVNIITSGKRINYLIKFYEKK